MEDHHWYKNAVFYEVSVKSFKDSNGDGIGDIRGLTSKLDYFVDLGINALWLLPFYPSPWKDDGYDVADYYGIHSDMGSMSDFDELIEEANKRGIKIIIDLVTNHTSDQHFWFQESRKDSSRDNPYADYYVWSDTDDKYNGVRVIFNDFEASNWTFDAVRKQYYWHRFFHHQPDLNFDNPKVHQEIFDILDFWLDKGIAGFRVDAIPYLYEREGTSCENLQETHQFLRKMREHVDERYGPNQKILLCESNMWQDDLLPYFGNKEVKEFDMGFDFPVMTRIYESLARENVSPLMSVMGEKHHLPDHCQWATFLRNHDELTLEKVTPEVREFMWKYYASDGVSKINLGVRKRLATLMENDQQKIKLLNSFLFALPGSPIIYYGQEIGMGTDLTLGDRNGVRTPMQWDRTTNAGFSDAEQSRLVFPVIDDDEYGYHVINVEDQKSDPNSLFNFIRKLIKLRKQYPFIGFSEYNVISFAEKKGIAIYHKYNGFELFCAFNFSSHTIEINKNLIGMEKSDEIRRVFDENTREIDQFVLDPYNFQWYYTESK